jgi:hypothetical protein
MKSSNQKLQPYRNFLIAEGFNPINVDIFLAYHIQNKQLWEEYQTKAFELINKGATRLSSKAIFEKLREDADLKTISTDFKITNTFTAYYSRIFVYKYPHYKGLFEFKPVNLKIAA